MADQDAVERTLEEMGGALLDKMPALSSLAIADPVRWNDAVRAALEAAGAVLPAEGEAVVRLTEEERELITGWYAGGYWTADDRELLAKLARIRGGE